MSNDVEQTIQKEDPKAAALEYAY